MLSPPQISAAIPTQRTPATTGTATRRLGEAIAGDYSPAIHPRIIFYDGVCGLCNRTVRRLVRLDRDRRFRYAPLQGELGSRIRRERDDVPADLDSFIYLEEGRVYLRSRALVRAARQLGYPWKLASWLWIIPWPLTDLVYRLIARIRYRVWGRYDECQIPTPEQRELFID